MGKIRGYFSYYKFIKDHDLKLPRAIKESLWAKECDCMPVVEEETMRGFVGSIKDTPYVSITQWEVKEKPKRKTVLERENSKNTE